MRSTTAPRPIFAAVATVGVSDRISFLRKTYAHLGTALVAFALLAGGMIYLWPETSLGFSKWALTGTLNWLMVLGAFMLVGYLAERLARSESSRALQYVGLGVAVIAQALLLQPVLWILITKLGGNDALAVVAQATTITIAIFAGLTLTVFVTKKDFSFLRGMLVIGSFAALGVIVTSIVFGFSLGAVFCGVMIVLMAGYILFQTSMVMSTFPPTAHVAASLMLFSTVATLFWYVLQLLLSLRRP